MTTQGGRILPQAGRPLNFRSRLRNRLAAFQRFPISQLVRGGTHSSCHVRQYGRPFGRRGPRPGAFVECNSRCRHGSIHIGCRSGGYSRYGNCVSWTFSFNPIAIAAGGLLTVDPQSKFSRFARELHRSVPFGESATQ